jgi:hypothetical protein
MKLKVLFLVGMVIVGFLSVSQAGDRRGCGPGGPGPGGPGGPGGGVRWGGGGNWGGGRPFCPPPRFAPPVWGWGAGPGWGWGGPAVAVRVVTPAPVYVTSYAQPTRYVTTTTFSDAVVFSAQEQLAGLGYYDGAIDGDFGPRTSRAVQRFQRDYGLPVTGRLDRNTRASLRL